MIGKRNTKSGFSLLEILLVVAMITILSGVFAPTFGNLFSRNNLDLASEKVKTDLYRAQTLAQASQNNTNWGVYLSPGLSTIFSGNSYASRNQAYDEVFTLAGNISFSGLNEIVFLKSSVKTLASGTITIIQDNETKAININSYGLIY